MYESLKARWPTVWDDDPLPNAAEADLKATSMNVVGNLSRVQPTACGIRIERRTNACLNETTNSLSVYWMNTSDNHLSELPTTISLSSRHPPLWLDAALVNKLVPYAHMQLGVFSNKS